MTAKKTWLISLGIVLLTSVYPIYMGAVMLRAYIQQGGIDAADYPSYIVPYTPICIALIICIALLPIALKLCGKFTLSALSVLGAVLFLAAETIFEHVVVFTDVSPTMNIETWQLLSCVVTPQVESSVWDSIDMQFNSSFKMHFYVISLLIVLTVIGVIYGFYVMAQSRNFIRKKPLIAQLIAAVLFIGLCVFACFTAFFRTGNIYISPISAILMTAFFLTFGIMAGIYMGTWLYEKQKVLAVFVPSVVAMAVTLIMYIGEMVMMDWTLFRFGSGFLFDPLGSIPFSFVDIVIILLSGMITYLILMEIRPKTTE